MNYKLVTVSRYLYEYEADLARSLLEEAGIECFITDQQFSNMNWGYALAIGGIRLQVRDEDLERSQQILGLQTQQESTKKVETSFCPNCRSGNTKTIKNLMTTNLSSLLTVIAGLMFMIAIPARHNRWCCLDCGYKWRHNHKKSDESTD